MPSKASRRFEDPGNSRANDKILKDKKGELAKMILDKPKSLKKMLEEKQVFATCIWNYMSARAAEKAGFEATLLASGPLSANVVDASHARRFIVSMSLLLFSAFFTLNIMPLKLLLSILS